MVTFFRFTLTFIMVTFFRFTLVGKLGRTASIMFIVSFAIRQLIAEDPTKPSFGMTMLDSFLPGRKHPEHNINY